MLNETYEDMAARRARQLKEASKQGHRPNLRITHRDGTVYRTLPSGTWVRVTQRKCNEAGSNGEIKNKGKHRRIARLA